MKYSYKRKYNRNIWGTFDITVFLNHIVAVGMVIANEKSLQQQKRNNGGKLKH